MGTINNYCRRGWATVKARSTSSQQFSMLISYMVMWQRDLTVVTGAGESIFWSVFPIVFVLGPTGFGLIGAALANLLYLILDIYTKIVFNVHLIRAS